MAAKAARRKSTDTDPVTDAELVRCLDAGGPLPDNVDEAAVDRVFIALLHRIDRRADKIEATLKSLRAAPK